MNDDISSLKKRTIWSVISLFLQSGYSAVLGLVANLVLTILLSPTIFGIYITVLSLISVLNYFSDIGLAASLIQKKEITDEDVSTTFTVQQILIITLISLAFFATSSVQHFYQLPKEGVYLFWALLISFFISSLKTIPSIFLERKIQFQKIVLVQMIENSVFYISTIILAVFHFGLLSFAIAVLLRAITGFVVIYSISFWLPTVGISMSSLKKLLSFGVPFQASSFLALFKDDLITLFLGKVLGFQGLGYIGWAKKWAEAPIRIIMDNISRVMFPVIARIQGDKKKVASLVEKILLNQTLLLAPTMIVLVLIMPKLLDLIPKYNKWQPALPLFYLFCISAFLASYSTPFINLFNAMGKVKIPLILMSFWTAANWILTVYLTNLFGFYGFPITQVILALTFVVVVYHAKKMIQINFLGSISKAIISAILTGLVMWALLTYLKTSFPTLSFTILIGGISYLIILRSAFRFNLIKHFRELLFHG